jgi:glc operon protein GlcG
MSLCHGQSAVARPYRFRPKLAVCACVNLLCHSTAISLSSHGNYLRLVHPEWITFVDEPIVRRQKSGLPCQAEKRRVSGVVSMLTLSKSKKIIDGAIQRARQLDARICVAVCGRDGRLIAFSRMDGCVGWDVDRSSLGVATAAAIVGCPSDQLSDRYSNGLRVSSFANVVPPRGHRGGLPIVEEGVVEGGCGVNGAATAEESEECTRAGIAALNTPARSRQRESADSI